ncbi:fibroblast growth factor receptor 2-like [Saccoglossus kowalevskii]
MSGFKSLRGCAIVMFVAFATNVVNTIGDDETGNDFCADDGHYLNFNDSLLVPSDITYIVVELKSRVTLDCNAYGDGDVSYTWRKMTYDTGEVDIVNKTTVTKDGTLVVESFSENDSAQYQCIVDNGYCTIAHHFEITSTTAPTVFEMPVVLNKTFPGNITATVGSNVALECKVQAPVSAYTFWLKHRQTMEAEESLQLLRNSWSGEDDFEHLLRKLFPESRVYVVFKGSLEFLTTNVAITDAGLYTCVSVNNSTIDYSSGWLAVMEQHRDPTCREYSLDGRYGPHSFNVAPEENITTTFNLFIDNVTRPITFSLDDPIPQEFDMSQSTKIIIHGFQQTGIEDWVLRMAESLIGIEDEYANIMSVDWGTAANPNGVIFNILDYHQAASNTRVVAQHVAALTQRLSGRARADIHIIGHSLGAHISGMIGRLVRCYMDCGNETCR